MARDGPDTSCTAHALIGDGISLGAGLRTEFTLG
jgi:hypothetical protein